MVIIREAKVGECVVSVRNLTERRFSSVRFFPFVHVARVEFELYWSVRIANSTQTREISIPDLEAEIPERISTSRMDFQLVGEGENPSTATYSLVDLVSGWKIKIEQVKQQPSFNWLLQTPLG